MIREEGAPTRPWVLFAKGARLFFWNPNDGSSRPRPSLSRLGPSITRDIMKEKELFIRSRKRSHEAERLIVSNNVAVEREESLVQEWILLFLNAYE